MSMSKRQLRSSRKRMMNRRPTSRQPSRRSPSAIEEIGLMGMVAAAVTSMFTGKSRAR